MCKADIDVTKQTQGCKWGLIWVLTWTGECDTWHDIDFYRFLRVIGWSVSKKINEQSGLMLLEDKTMNNTKVGYAVHFL